MKSDRAYVTLARASGVLLVLLCVLFQRRGLMDWTELAYLAACVGLLEVFSRARGLRRVKAPLLFVYSLLPLGLVLYHGEQIKALQGDFVQMVLQTPLPLVLITVQIMVLYVRDAARLVSVVLVLALFSVVIGVRRPVGDTIWPWLAAICVAGSVFLVVQHPGMLFAGVYTQRRRSPHPPSGKPGGILRPSFFSVLPLLALSVLTVALALYLGLPRLYQPPPVPAPLQIAPAPVTTPEPTRRPSEPTTNPNRPPRNRPPSVSGLSDGVDLGDFGQIKLSNEPALELKLVAPANATLERVYLRAFTYGTFDGWGWAPLPDPQPDEPADLRSVPAGVRRALPGAPRSSGIGWATRRYQILLAEAGIGAGGRIPLPVEPQAVLGYEGALVYDGRAHTLTAPEIAPGDSYIVEAHQLVAADAQLRRMLAGSSPAMHPRLEYSQLPPGLKAKIQDRFGFYERYAAMIDGREPGTRRGVYDAAQDIVTMFREATTPDGKAWIYSLDFRPRPGGDSIVRFLDTRTKDAERFGHCEYFASAMCLLLRCYGVPARVVAGFTADRPDLDGTFDVRASAAHAWVEVYFENFGWLTFDPTPPEDSNARPPDPEPEPEPEPQPEPEPVVDGNDTGGQRDLFREFDRQAQEELFREIGAFVDSSVKRAEEELSGVFAWMPDFLPRHGLLRAVIVAAPTVALIALWLWRRRKRKKIEARALRQMGGAGGRRQRGLYLQLLLLLARYGFQKRSSETPREFAERVLRRGGRRHDAIRELTEIYYALRFGLDESLEDDFKSGLARYADALRESQSESSASPDGPQPA